MRVRCLPSVTASTVGRILLVAVVAVLSGCEAGDLQLGWQGRWQMGPLQTWAVPPDTVVFPYAAAEWENEVFSRSDGRIRLAGAIGETVAFQLVLASTTSAVVDSVTVADLEGEHAVLEADRVTIYRQHLVTVADYPSWYLRLTPHLRQERSIPDILVPLTAPDGGLPIRVQPNACEALWVDIAIPPGTRPGRYRSSIQLRGGVLGQTREMPIELEVWPFALPQSRHLAMLAGLDTGRLLSHHLRVGGRPYRPDRLSFDDPHYEQARLVLDRAVRLLHAHRCDTMLRDVQPIRRVAVDGQLSVDWLDYDRLVAPILDGSAFEDRTAPAAWPLPVDEHRPDPQLYGGWDSPGYAAVLGQYLHQCAEHFAQRGWLDRHFVWLPVDGASPHEHAERFLRLARIAEEADPRLRLVSTLSAEQVGLDRQGTSERVTIWAPPAHLADRAALADLRARGDRTWFRPDRPPFSGSLAMQAPPTYARVLAWQAYRLGSDGVFLPIVNDWPDDGRPAAEVAERCLIWPGSAYGLDGPVPSIRLKHLRRSVQDYEYLWLLERNERPGIARRLAQDLCRLVGTDVQGDHALDGRAGGWVTQPGAWTQARRLMAEELVAVMSGPGPRERGDALPDEPAERRYEHLIGWERFRESVREQRVTVEGARIRSDDGRGSGAMIEVAATVANFTADPLSGTLAIPDLPQGWSPVEEVSTIGQLAPREWTERRVQLMAEQVMPNVEGVQSFDVELTNDRGQKVTAAGRLSFLTSLEVTRPLTIDGSLDDWPLGSGNVAGDFLLVGARSVPKHDLPRPDRPTQATTVFVAHDARYLYIAFFCMDDRMEARHVPADNTVHYDALWPTRDDLVEVVIDPSADATDAGGLLHIVVKANGAVVTQRGVASLSEVAEHVPWAAGVVAAVDDRSEPNRWTVEIRIPWEALGPRAEIFGINFARFQPRLGEYASWSGADRYLYTPVSLGNIRVPR